MCTIITNKQAARLKVGDISKMNRRESIYRNHYAINTEQNRIFIYRFEIFVLRL